jgi:serine/threonine protein kinase
MTTLAEFATQILTAAGVSLGPNKGDTASVNPVGLLEQWLGLDEDDAASTDVPTLEELPDLTSLAPQVYPLLRHLLIHVWTQTLSTALDSSRIFTLPADSPSKQNVTVESLWEVVRVTHWLRHWMNVHAIVASRGSGERDRTKSLTSYLLEGPLENGFGPQSLVRALFAHVEQLPVLQAQIHSYTQTLQQRGHFVRGRNHDNQTTELVDPTSRLQQYEQTQVVSQRMQQEWRDHVDRMEVIVASVYRVGDVATRSLSRRLLGRVWSQYVFHTSSANSGNGGGLRHENTRAAAIAMTLRVLHRILQGVGTVQPAHKSLLFKHLIPLHQPNAMVLWRDQTTVLELYHEVLTQNVALLLQKEPCLLPDTIAALVQTDVFPTAGSASKQVLLLHEIDTYFDLFDPENLRMNVLMDRSWAESLLTVLARCIACDHSGVAQRALKFFQKEKFVDFCVANLDRTLPLLLPSLVRREPSWNPTVRKMTYHVLCKLKQADETRFTQVCNRIHEEYEQNQAAPIAPLERNSTSSLVHKKEPKTSLTHSGNQSTTFSSPLSGIYSRHTPANRSRETPSSMPPPLARPPSSGRRVGIQSGGSDQPLYEQSSPIAGFAATPWNKSSGQAPPLTVTGVAPWAIKGTNSLQARRKISSAALTPKRDAHEAQLGSVEEGIDKDFESTENLPRLRGIDIVLDYMERMKPQEEAEGASFWSKEQMAEAPTLLSNLKFHDLVFGHDLGVGAFGSVRYARLIDQSTTRSHWAEYAVKVISTEKICELGYEASVQREIAVLRVLSHPCIARLVSSFRFREGAYLVLEYASGGDLFNLLQKHGSLDHDSSRFVIGEIVAALASIHELGLVYADLKPENVVITEVGHIKLTDFGGCRAVTAKAKELIQSVGKNLLKKLRDGDWKANGKKPEEADNDSVDTHAIYGETVDTDEDLRIEGTTAYLPPEVVMGAFPNFAADSWALGCVLYQCLSGRPPLLEMDETATRHRIVTFDSHQSTNDLDRLFQEKHAAGISTHAKDLIINLLARDALKRPDMQRIAQFGFFTDADIDVFSLHRKTPYPLDVGDVAASREDSKWTRRQFSSIWAPQPAAYNIQWPEGSEPESSSDFGDALSGPIVEGDEATSSFCISPHAPGRLPLVPERLVPPIKDASGPLQG